MTLAHSDPDLWEKLKPYYADRYGAEVVTFANRWACLMEEKLANGENLANIAKQTRHEANTEGLTEFRYALAVGMLSSLWIYGAQLWRWHLENIFLYECFRN